MLATKIENSQPTQDYFNLIENEINQAGKKGIGQIINIGSNLIESINACEVAKKFQNVFATTAIHPCDCKENWHDEFKTITNLVEKKVENKIVAVGETGLDFYHKPFYVERQKDAFKAHIELALKNNLPLVVHSRDASEEVLKTLEEYIKNGLRGVIHCFSHEKYLALTALSWGFYLGIGAYITYPKNTDLRELIKNEIPVNKILLETDAPFLPPQEYRGKPNRPEYIPIFAKMIAELKNIDLKILEETTTINAKVLFDI